jgi:hypothetical protein
MKKYWVLAWDQYYPKGGLGNVHSVHDSEDSAREIAKNLEVDGAYEYVEVVDISYLL